MEEAAYRRMYELEDRHWWFRGRRRVLHALIAAAGPPPAPRVLDAGCGTGRNLAELARYGEVAGVDPSAHAIAFCRARGAGGVVQAGLDALPFPAGAFGLLAAADVIEHVRDDRGALAELRRVAAPGAVLVLTAPAYRWLWSAHDVEHHHVRRYTLRALAARAREAGWAPVRATYFNSLLLPAVAAVRLAARARGAGGGDLDRTPRGLDRVLEAPLRAEAWAIGRGARLPAGVSIGLACRAAGHARV